jgi:hypothetical protein
MAIRALGSGFDYVSVSVIVAVVYVVAITRIGQ